MTIDEQLGRLIRLLNPYSTDMKQSAGTPTPTGSTLTPARQQATTEGDDQGQFPLQVDNYDGEWTFKGNPYKVTKALRITYRYPLYDNATPPKIVCYATEHLLIGYAGGNGG
jgi:hypothetical protein